VPDEHSLPITGYAFCDGAEYIIPAIMFTNPISIPESWDELMTFRLVVAIIVLLLLLPTIVTGITHTDQISVANDTRRTTIPTENVTFITAQGKQSSYSWDQSRLVAFDTDGDPVWIHDRYSRYYDVDPLGNGRLLFVASAKDVEKSKFTGEFIAVTMNWRTGEVYHRFTVPPDTHDVDYLGNEKYSVADKEHNSVYVYNRTRGEIVWNYSFQANFPPPSQTGGPPTDFTHLNDVDTIANGSMFLVSPRNFDRVMAINRSTKEIEWTLGEKNNFDILKKQHNPALLSRDPLTVLVADSENHRIVEFRRTDDGWTKDWVYKGNLNWPRDADRLPNGNTLIVDSSNHRVIEVTPNGTIVRETHLKFSPYDAERPAFGDEPAGPTMRELGQTGTIIVEDQNTLPATLNRIADSFSFAYSMAQWVIPSWIGPISFGLLTLVPVVLVGWISVELTHSSRVRGAIRRLRRSRAVLGLRSRVVRPLLPTVCLLVGGALILIGLTPGELTALSNGLGIVLLLEGATLLNVEKDSETFAIDGIHLLRPLQGALSLAAVLVATRLAMRANQVSGVLTEVYVGLVVIIAVSALRRHL
jgi:hypothetical protein